VFIRGVTFVAESMEIENSSAKFAAAKNTPVIISLRSLNEDLTAKTREENRPVANGRSR